MSNYKEFTKLVAGNKSDIIINEFLEQGWKIKNVYSVANGYSLILFYVDNYINLKKENIENDIPSSTKTIKRLTKDDILTSSYLIECTSRYHAAELCKYVSKYYDVFWTNNNTLVNITNHQYASNYDKLYYNFNNVTFEAYNRLDPAVGMKVIDYNTFMKLPN